MQCDTSPSMETCRDENKKEKKERSTEVHYSSFHIKLMIELKVEFFSWKIEKLKKEEKEEKKKWKKKRKERTL